MYYSGKKLDFFELAVQQMMENTHGAFIEHVDCMSLRCFGFRMGASVKEWFSPRINIVQATESLSNISGLSFGCESCGQKDWRSIKISRCVFGPIENGTSVREIKSYYYNGLGKYICAEFYQQDKVRVFDPQGLPELIIESEEFFQTMLGSEAYRVYLEKADDSWSMPELKKIFQRGIEFHGRIEVEEYAEMQEAVEKYVDSRSNRISLQYAVMNLVLQLDKVFRLADDCGALKEDKKKEYMLYKQQLYKSGRKEDIVAIPEIVSRVWGLFNGTEVQ